MTFSIHLTTAAQKFLKKAEEEVYNRVVAKLREMQEDPFPADAKRVHGRQEKVFRVRVGDYRILYLVYIDRNVILVVNIDHRSTVYKW